MGCWLTTSCASDTGRPWHGSLEQVLTLMPSIATGQEVIDKFGPPSATETFNHDDRGNKYFPNRYPIDLRKDAEIATPPDLIDTLAIGTELLLYRFEYGSTINPSKDILTICIDKSGEVMGWMYDRGVVGHESEYFLVK
jgi:hypothetical protein